MKFSTLMAVLCIMSCSEPSTSNDVKPSGEAQLSTRELQAIAEAKEALPQHAKYVDDRGKFDVRACGRDLYATGDYENGGDAMTRAREMNTEWKAMVDEKGSQIL